MPLMLPCSQRQHESAGMREAIRDRDEDAADDFDLTHSRLAAFSERRPVVKIDGEKNYRPCGARARVCAPLHSVFATVMLRLSVVAGYYTSLG